MSLRGIVPPDPQTGVSQERFAVIFTPRQNRKRFPAGCVEIFDTLEAALAAADPEKKRYAARVVGPSKSSEGQYIYYLLMWLE
ncbi:MAG: hypothetical protein LJE75_04585 [Gammaproteobacteria bacterium]|jgi:hypothetical protein|nr:hypothetical protein [Gammaproteobacteria bacterium]